MHPTRFDHQKREAREYGYSPGNGISPMGLSLEPLATEEEADAAMDELDDVSESRSPAAGDDDPFLFDDIGEDLSESLPAFDLEMADGPMF